MIDIKRINIGDKVRCLFERDLVKPGDVGEVVTITTEKVVVECSGTMIAIRPDEGELIGDKINTRGITSPFADNDKTAKTCTSMIEGTMTARFKSQSVTVRDVVNAMVKLPDRAYVNDIECSMFDHKEDGPITVVTIRYRIDDTALPIVQYRGGPLRVGEMVSSGTIPCEIVNKQGT